MAELEELQDINSELDGQTVILENILLELQAIKTDSGNIDLKLVDTNGYLYNQELRNISNDTILPVEDYREYLSEINNRTTDLTAMTSYNFIFIGVIIGLLIVNFFAVMWRKI